MLQRNSSKTMWAAAGATLAACGVIAFAIVVDKAKAGGSSEFGASFKGSFALRWDHDNDQIFDLQCFATFAKGGVFLIDGFVLPPGVTGELTPISVGNGHGKWRYNSTKNKFIFEAVHGDPGGDTAFFHLKGSFEPPSDLSEPGTGTVHIEAFGALDDDVVDFVVDSDIGAYDLTLYTD